MVVVTTMPLSSCISYGMQLDPMVLWETGWTKLARITHMDITRTGSPGEPQQLVDGRISKTQSRIYVCVKKKCERYK